MLPISDRTSMMCLSTPNEKENALNMLIDLGFNILGYKRIHSSLLIESIHTQFDFFTFVRNLNGLLLFILIEHNHQKFSSFSRLFDEQKNKISSYVFIDVIEFNNIFRIVFGSKLRKLQNIIFKRSIEFQQKTDKVLFVVTYRSSSTFNLKESAIRQHYGISVLIALLKKNGILVELLAFIDSPVWEIVNKIIAVNPRIVGFTSVTSEFSYICDISEELYNRVPDIYTIGGGPHFTLCPHDILVTHLDSVCIGEGEQVLLDLVNNKPLDKIRGLVTRTENGYRINPPMPWINKLDELPIPDYRIWDSIVQEIDRETISIIVSRGCSFNCSYCANRAISKVTTGNYVRFRSKKSIQRELDFLINTYKNLKKVFLDTECLIPNYKNVDEILEIVKSYNKRLIFGTNIRLGTFNLKFLEKLKSSGIAYVNFGIESGSESLRKGTLKRDYTNSEIVLLTEQMHKLGLDFSTYNMIGIPNETVNDFSKTISINQEIKPYNSLISTFFPYPGTSLYYTALRNEHLDNPFFYHRFDGSERYDSVLQMKEFPSTLIKEYFQWFKRYLFKSY